MYHPNVPDHPYLRLLGPIGVIGAQGVIPPHGARACIEYLAWVMRHPDHTTTQLASDLLVADSTRRSNLSRLRGWLGRKPDGDHYLPEAQTGRVHLDALVRSDWDDMMMLLAPGVERTSEAVLCQALELVHGTPFTNAPAGQWGWAEEWRLEVDSTIRHIGLTLAERALARRDLDLARWAAARAQTVAPEDDHLMIIRIRTEHAARNKTEVRRLMLHVTRQTRALGLELSDEMAEVFVEVTDSLL